MLTHSQSLAEVLTALTSLEGFETFEVPGETYLARERRYKDEASAKTRELFDLGTIFKAVEGNDTALLQEKLRTVMKANGFSNMMGWRDVDMVFKPLATETGREDDLIAFYRALIDLQGFHTAALVADQLATALHGTDAGKLKSHMWATISYLFAMLRPQDYVFVKPRITDWFFKRIGSSYQRPKDFSGAAYEGFVSQCKALSQELASAGYPPRDMIDLQSFIWIVYDKEVASAPKRPIRELLRAAASALTSENPDGFTVKQVCTWLNENHPRDDDREWEGNMVQVGDYAIWADSGEICSPSTQGEAAYPKFLACLTREQPYRYQLIEEKANMTATVAQAGTTTLFDHVKAEGLWLSDEVLTNYALALKTKPFVILTGISGTGKTKIAQLFAEYYCPPELRTTPEKPENSETTFYVRVSRSMLNHGFLNVNSELRDYFDPAEKGVGVDVSLKLPDGSTHLAKLLDIKFAKETAADQVRLTFKKEFHQWLKANFALGDLLQFEKYEGYFSLRRYAPKAAHLTKSDRYEFISVRPDWTDNRGLLGYYNPLFNTYEATDLLKLMLRAEKDPDRPYFAILDEMNLAKVEHYFSDFLSCLESRRLGEYGKMKQERIRLHDQQEPVAIEDGTYRIPQSMEIPANLYFTGTVNVDETTYMFSPKVLDRANTIEFNHVDLAAYGGNGPGHAEAGSYRLKEGFELTPLALPAKRDYDLFEAKGVLETINAILMPAQLHFGYRVANEIALYVRHATAWVGADALSVAMDLQIVQKVLPKLHGSRAKLESPLQALLYFCVKGEAPGAGGAGEWIKTNWVTFALGSDTHLEVAGTPARYPRAGAKVFRMLQTLREQGYASFVT